jgi:hypothetical protein
MFKQRKVGEEVVEIVVAARCVWKHASDGRHADA